MPLTFTQDGQQPTPDASQLPATPTPGADTVPGSLTFNQPDPYSQPDQSWGDWAKTKAGLAARALMEYSPYPNLPAQVWNLGQYEGSLLGDSPRYIPTPGGAMADAMNLPQPKTMGEHVFSSAVGWPVGAATSGERMAQVLRALPAEATVGAGMGTTYAMDPNLQLAIGAGAQGVASRVFPGMSTTANAVDQARAQFLKSEGVPVNPVDLGPGAAKFTYGAGSRLPLSGSGTYADNQFNAWTNAVAKRFGGTTTDGLFTDGVIGRGYARVNDLYDQLRSGNDVPADTNSPLFTKLAQVSADANQYDPTIAKGVDNVIHGLLTTAQGHGGALPAGEVIDMLNTKSSLTKRAAGTDPAADYYEGIRSALEDEFGNSRSQADQAMLTDAKNSYRSLKTVERARDPATDLVTPQSLAAAANPTRKYQVVGNDLSQLGVAGNRFIAVPPSKTATPVGEGAGPSALSLLRDVGVTGLGAGEIAGIAHSAGLPATTAGVVGAVGSIPSLYAATLLGRTGGLGAPPPSPSYASALLGTPGVYVNPTLGLVPQQ